MKKWQNGKKNGRVKHGRNFLIYSAEVVRSALQPKISLLIAYNPKGIYTIKWIHRTVCLSIGLNSGKVTCKSYAKNAMHEKAK